MGILAMLEVDGSGTHRQLHHSQGSAGIEPRSTARCLTRIGRLSLICHVRSKSTTLAQERAWDHQISLPKCAETELEASLHLLVDNIAHVPGALESFGTSSYFPFTPETETPHVKHKSGPCVSWY